MAYANEAIFVYKYVFRKGFPSGDVGNQTTVPSPFSHSHSAPIP